jgi:hypothetical protein
MDGRISVKIIDEPSYNGSAIILYKWIGTKLLCLKEANHEWVPCEAGERYPVAVRIPAYEKYVLHELSRELSRIGIKPDVEQNYINTQAATEKHLEDMRKIVWHTLKIAGRKPSV